jgi:hypothetical protein
MTDDPFANDLRRLGPVNPALYEDRSSYRDEPLSKRKALPFIAFDDIQVKVEKPWVMKGFLARGETSSLIGGPGKGKSALATDIAVHVASGWNWRGYRSKERCAVVILAFERADLMLRRLEAYKRKHNLADLPVVVIRVPVDIRAPESVEILSDTIQAVERRFHLPVGLVILDTYSKALALGGGDENSAKDVNRFLGQLRIIQTQTSVHVCLVGHTGKDETRGHRGSNAHLGDVDLEITISGEVTKTATITKANDQQEGPLTIYSLETYSFGTDEDGDEITTSIVSGDVPEREAKAPSKRALSDRQRIALDSLTEALITFGKEPWASLQLPRNTRVVEAGAWRDEMFRRGALDKDASNPRADFIRVRDSLITRGLIGFRDEFAWRIE